MNLSPFKKLFKPKPKLNLSKNQIIALGLLASLLFVGAWLIFKPSIMSNFKSAGRDGQVAVYQLMVKINDGVLGSGFQRGDVILVAPEDKKWSQAEQDGFLIIKTRLTQRQTELLVRSANQGQRINYKDKKQPLDQDSLPLRSFTINLQGIGIANDVQQGRVMSDKVYDWKDIIEVK